MTPTMNDVFRALADPTRRSILRELRAGERTAGELAQLFPLSKSTLSGHFNVLKHADLIAWEKRGTVITYRLNTTVFQDVLTHMLDLFSPTEPSPDISNVANEPRGGEAVEPQN